MFSVFIEKCIVSFVEDVFHTFTVIGNEQSADVLFVSCAEWK